MLADLVTYDRSARVYRVQVADDVAEFPAGSDGRRNAFRLAIWEHDNALYELADKLAKKHPELGARCWKAPGLLLREK